MKFYTLCRATTTTSLITNHISSNLVLLVHFGTEDALRGNKQELQDPQSKVPQQHNKLYCMAWKDVELVRRMLNKHLYAAHSEITDQLTELCCAGLNTDLLRSLVSYLHTLSGKSMVEELNFLTQEKEKDVHYIVSRIQDCAIRCELSSQCKNGGGDEKVFKSEQAISNTIMTRLYNMDTRLEVSASEDLVAEDCEPDAYRAECCRNCGKNGHGRSSDGDTRKETCLDGDKYCSRFSKKSCQIKQNEEKIHPYGKIMTAGHARVKYISE